MIVLGVYLFQKGQDFGLFKLAMWAQPVIALCLAQGFAGVLFSERPVVRMRARIALASLLRSAPRSRRSTTPIRRSAPTAEG